MLAQQTHSDPAGWKLDELIACPVCDALLRDREVSILSTARCPRCHSVIAAPRERALTNIVMLAITAVVLMWAAVFFPFLEISAKGLNHKSSLFDAVLAFSDGLMLPLSFAVAALIIVLPLIRLSAIIYALAPMALGWHPWRHAITAFRVSELLRPWAMAEIFVVGVAIALVKVAGLATLSIGPAFWALALLVVVMALKDMFMCRITIWKTLSTRAR